MIQNIPSPIITGSSRVPLSAPAIIPSSEFLILPETTPRPRPQPETTSLWTQAFNGEVEVSVRPAEAGQLVVQTAPLFTNATAMSELPSRLMEGLRLGHSNTQMAVKTDYSEASVSRWTRRELARLGLVRQVVPLCARVLERLNFFVTTRHEIVVTLLPPPSWSDAEAEVASLALAGQGIAEIAGSRKRSPATIRKQLRHAAHKLNCADVPEVSARVQFSLSGSTR